MISPCLCPETLRIKTQTYLQVLVFIIHRKSLYLVKLKCLLFTRVVDQKLPHNSPYLGPVLSFNYQLSNPAESRKGPNIAVFWEDIEGKYCFSTLNCCTMIIFNFNSEPFHCVLLSLRYIIHSNPLFAHFVVLFKFSSLIIWKHSGYEFFSSQSIFAWSKLVNWNLRTSMEWYKKCILFYSGLQSFLGKHKTFMGSLTSMQYFHVD